MTSLFDLLKFDKIGIGSAQVVDEMSVIPLVGRSRGNIASPENLQFESTINYGSMKFKNEDTTKPAIVPTHLMIRATGAQDHAMSGSGIVAASKSKVFKNACCIEETQGGLLGSLRNEEDILPISLRRSLLNPGKRSEPHYGKLWEDIKSWMRGLNIKSQSGAHLRYFYDNQDIKQSLEQFAAEFEPVDGQIGAVILFGGVPVGLEIMPSEDHWNTYWKHLIRGCYGAELIRLKALGKIQPSTLILPDIPKDAQPEQVQQILEQFAIHLSEEIIPLLENINISTNNKLSSSQGLDTRLITTASGGGGDIILEGPEPIYVSLVI